MIITFFHLSLHGLMQKNILTKSLKSVPTKNFWDSLLVRACIFNQSCRLKLGEGEGAKKGQNLLDGKIHPYNGDTVKRN